jgi:hypothetical protein
MTNGSLRIDASPLRSTSRLSPTPCLPGEPFDISVVAGHRVDRKSRVSVRGCLYSAAHVGKRLDAGRRRHHHRVPGQQVARHARGLKGDEVLALDHYLEVLAIKTGAFAGATALARARMNGSGPRLAVASETAISSRSFCCIAASPPSGSLLASRLARCRLGRLPTKDRRRRTGSM